MSVSADPLARAFPGSDPEPLPIWDDGGRGQYMAAFGFLVAGAATGIAAGAGATMLALQLATWPYRWAMGRRCDRAEIAYAELNEWIGSLW